MNYNRMMEISHVSIMENKISQIEIHVSIMEKDYVYFPYFFKFTVKLSI